MAKIWCVNDVKYMRLEENNGDDDQPIFDLHFSPSYKVNNMS